MRHGEEPFQTERKDEHISECSIPLSISNNDRKKYDLISETAKNRNDKLYNHTRKLYLYVLLNHNFYRHPHNKDNRIRMNV